MCLDRIEDDHGAHKHTTVARVEINGLMFAAHMKSEATHEREIQRIIIGVGYDQNEDAL